MSVMPPVLRFWLSTDVGSNGRIRYQVQYANALNFTQEANKLAALIKQYSIGGDSLFVN